MRVPTVLVAPGGSTQLPKLDSIRGADPQAGAILAEGFNALSGAFQRHADKVKQDQDNLDQFELNQTYLDEVNASALEFNTAKEQAPPGAPNFAVTYDAQLKAKHEKLLDEMESYGYKPEALHEFNLKLQTLRTNQLGTALSFQNQQEDIKAGVDMDQVGTSATQYARNNPDAIDSVTAYIEEQVNLHPHLDAGKKAVFVEKLKEQAIAVGGAAYVQMHPDEVIKAYDPQGLYAKQQGISASGTAATYSGANLNADIVNYAKSKGLTDAQATALAAVSHAEGGQLDNTNPAGGGHGAYGLFQIRDSGGLQAMRDKYGPHPTMQQQVDFYLANNVGNNTAFKNATDAKEAAKVLVYEVQRAGKDSEALLSRTHKAIGDPVATPVPTSHSYTALTPPMKTVNPDEALNKDTPLAPTSTGIRILDLQPGDAQLKLLNQAYAAKQQTNAQDHAAAVVAHENNIASIQATGKPVTPLDEASLAPIVGAVQAHQMVGAEAAWAGAFPFIQTLPMANPAQVRAGLERLKPGPNTDPTLFAQQQEIYNKAASAAQANMAERERDPVAYIFANNAKVAGAFNSAQDRNGRKAAYLALAQNMVTMGMPRDQWLPMTKDQLVKTKDAYQHLPPEQRLAQIENWSAEIPAEMRGNFAKAMTDGDGTGPGADFFMLSLFRNHPEYRNFAGDYFKGLLQIKEDPALKPSSAAMNQAFGGDNGAGASINRLGPLASAYINRATEALYVAAGGKTVGQPGTLIEGLSNPTLYKESFRRAVGGLPGNENTGFFENTGHWYSGTSKASGAPITILPPGMTVQDWTRRLHSQTIQSLTANSAERLPPVTKFGNSPSMQDIIDHGTFVMTGPGGYEILMPDGGYLKTSSNHNFILKVRK